jgi:hypothetical protein
MFLRNLQVPCVDNKKINIFNVGLVDHRLNLKGIPALASFIPSPGCKQAYIIR